MIPALDKPLLDAICAMEAARSAAIIARATNRAGKTAARDRYLVAFLDLADQFAASAAEVRALNTATEAA